MKARGMCTHSRLGEMSKKLCPTACGVCVPFGEKTEVGPKTRVTSSGVGRIKKEGVPVASKSRPGKCLSDVLWRHKMVRMRCTLACKHVH